MSDKLKLYLAHTTKIEPFSAIEEFERLNFLIKQSLLSFTCISEVSGPHHPYDSSISGETMDRFIGTPADDAEIDCEIWVDNLPSHNNRLHVFADVTDSIDKNPSTFSPPRFLKPGIRFVVRLAKTMQNEGGNP